MKIFLVIVVLHYSRWIYTYCIILEFNYFYLLSMFNANNCQYQEILNAAWNHYHKKHRRVSLRLLGFQVPLL